MNNKLCFYLIPLLSLALAEMTSAANFIQTNSFAIGEGEVLSGEFWLAANSIQIKGEARNDLFLLSTGESWGAQDEKQGAILLSGKFEDDVWALGNTIALTGAIRDHARLLAKAITIDGSVSNSSILIGNSVHVTKSAHLGSDTLIAGENTIMEGDIAGNLTVFCKSATLAGKISGNTKITAADIIVLPQTEIAGNLIYASPTELVLDKNVVLHGQLIREAEAAAKTKPATLISWPSILMQSWFFLGAICVGTLMLVIFPGFTDESARQVQASFWKCMFTGFIAVSLAPMACFFLAISIIGLPLASLIAMSLLILTYLSKITVALMLGTFIVRRRNAGFKALPVLGLGLALLYLITGAGLLGVIFWFLIVCLGIGGMIFAGIEKRNAECRRPNEETRPV